MLTAQKFGTFRIKTVPMICAEIRMEISCQYLRTKRLQCPASWKTTLWDHYKFHSTSNRIWCFLAELHDWAQNIITKWKLTPLCSPQISTVIYVQSATVVPPDRKRAKASLQHWQQPNFNQGTQHTSPVWNKRELTIWRKTATFGSVLPKTWLKECKHMWSCLGPCNFGNLDLSNRSAACQFSYTFGIFWTNWNVQTVKWMPNLHCKCKSACAQQSKCTHKLQQVHLKDQAREATKPTVASERSGAYLAPKHRLLGQIQFDKRRVSFIVSKIVLCFRFPSSCWQIDRIQVKKNPLIFPIKFWQTDFWASTGHCLLNSALQL